MTYCGYLGSSPVSSTGEETVELLMGAGGPALGLKAGKAAASKEQHSLHF